MAFPKFKTTGLTPANLKPGNLRTPTPVYAVVGAGDLVVEKLREVRLPHVDSAREVKDVPVQFAGQMFSTAGAVYSGLATRGQGLVTRVRNRDETVEAEEQAGRTASQAKGAATTARKGAKSTTTRAKAASTSARKTADKSATAAKKAAEETGS